MGRKLPPPAWVRPQPPPPQRQPEEPRRPQSFFSYGLFAFALVAGLVLGLGLSWALGPLPQRNTEPFQLREEDHKHYMIAIALEYGHRGDLHRALEKLVSLRPLGDPLQALADAACELASSDYINSESGVEALRMAARMYTAQGRSGCAEALLPAEDLPDEPAADPDPAAPLPSPTPPPTKTPSRRASRATATLRAAATSVPQRTFSPLPASTFCDTAHRAVIEVRIVDYLGRGIPGQRIRLRWGDEENVFLSGLKPERGSGYADFQMNEGISYSIDMPGASEALRADLITGRCYTESGRESLKSFRVTFRADS
ncbi:MAG: hypothetical protein OXT68_15335 [Chloroflexota bacterium]|nr:hypothetical protein [Chloroflexota bacterium]